MDQNLHIWLGYVSCPITTAAYLEKAFRKICKVTTIGPMLPEMLIEGWNLQNLKQPVLPHDVDTAGVPDMAALLASMPARQHPDLYVWVESVGTVLPLNLSALSCPKICYLVDSHIHLSTHLEISRSFDYVFIAQLEYVEAFRAINPAVYWLPLACDPEVHGKKDLAKLHDISFVGGIGGEMRGRRNMLLSELQTVLPVHYERCFLDEMARLYSASKIVFNEAVNNDLNMRFFEVLSSGSLLLSDLARNSGQDILFRNGEDYALYDDNHLVDTARFYLENEQLREQIAARGRALVLNAHTYHHRVEDLLNVVLRGKPDTFSSEELRERSLIGLDEPYRNARESVTINCASRSFVIPVLDYSPASEYSILTLLNDLEKIPGDVIVIFNSEEVAEELKYHPRITHFAVMKRNIGVARAWNVGMDIAETATVFIVNADAHLTQEAVDVLEQELWRLDRAACVGPQGAFFNFELCSDYHYFDKGTFDQSVSVDAVSGFFFCVKRELFENKTLQFENSFTPCYFEEWDLGLQIKKAGMKCYVVPTTAYDHHWSGTIRALNTIPYYDREETAGDILKRNRMLFLLKWRGVMRRENADWLLESGWKRYALEEVHKQFLKGGDAAATQLASDLADDFPEDREIRVLKRFAMLQASKLRVHEQTPIPVEMLNTSTPSSPRFRSIITSRYSSNWPTWQMVYEWEDILANLLGAQLKPLGESYSESHSGDGEQCYDLMFFLLAEDLRHYEGNRQIIPIVLDLWRNDFTDFLKRACSFPLVFVTSRQVFRELSPILHNLRYLPFCLADQYLNWDLPFKDIDIIHYGRRNPLLDKYMGNFLERYPATSYVTTEVMNRGERKVFFISNHDGVLAESDSRKTFMNFLGRSKISLVSTVGMDGSRETGGIDPVSPRFYESLAAGCLLLGRIPNNEEFRESGMNAFCQHVDSYDAFEATLLALLKNEHIARENYIPFLQHNLASTLAPRLLAELYTLSNSDRESR